MVRAQLHPGKGILAILMFSCEVSPTPVLLPGLELLLLSPTGQCRMRGQPGVAVCPRAQVAQGRAGCLRGFQEDREGRDTELWELCALLWPCWPCWAGSQGSTSPRPALAEAQPQPQLWHTASACRGGDPDVPVCCLCLSPATHHPSLAPISHPWHPPSAQDTHQPSLAPPLHSCSCTLHFCSSTLHPSSATHPSSHTQSLLPLSIPAPTVNPCSSTLHSYSSPSIPVPTIPVSTFPAIPSQFPPSIAAPRLAPAPVKLLEQGLQDLLPACTASKDSCWGSMWEGSLQLQSREGFGASRTFKPGPPSLLKKGKAKTVF